MGDSQVRITGVNGIEEAQPGDLCFVRDARYLPHLRCTRAAAVLIAEPFDECPLPMILVPEPDIAFARIVRECVGKDTPRHPKGIHETAIIGENVVLGEEVAIGAHSHVGDGCRIDGRVVIYAGVYIGHDCQIGEDTIIYPNVTIRESTEVGKRCVLHAGAAIGSDGFGFVPLDGAWAKIPQVGRVIIGDDVEFGSNSAIDRATFGATRIGRGTKIDNLVQIGHNVVIGDHCVIAGMAGIAGSTTIGHNVRIGPGAAINGHITIGDGATIGGRSGVPKSIEAGRIVSGNPAKDHSLERRVLVAQQRLPELLRRVRQLERQIQELKDKIP